MKNSIIEELFFNEGIGERLPQTKERQKASDKAFELYNRLMDCLSDEQKEIFNNFTELETSVSAKQECSCFKEGVRIGLLLAIECLA